MVSTYGQLYLVARRMLTASEGEQAANTARELLCIASGKSAEQILAHREMYASEQVCQRMAELVDRKATGEPLAYILGEWDFYGMHLYVTPDVLIPRDDTMAVTEAAIHLALSLPQNPRILDLCTGSGCIGLAVAKRIKDARVTLGDISEAALRVAKKNVQAQKLTGRVSCLQVDACKPASRFLGKFDMIISNPPYVTEAEMQDLEPSVRDFEPHLALDGGPNGLRFYREILINYTPALNPGGVLCFEFGMGQHEAVCELLRQWEYEEITCKCDARGVIRAVTARKRKEPEENGNEESSL